DHVITMEDITEGERVREYLIEGLVDGNWQQIVEGISIGHKKIDRFDPVAVEAVRIRVIKSAAEPIIRKLAVYNVSGEELTVKLAKPTPQQAAWQDTEIGMFICFGLWSWPIGVTEELDVLADTQKKFNPTDIDTDQWVSVAESMGAKYVLFTAKHGDGFCMWQTDTTDFSIKNTPWRDGKGDILADLAESCRKRGMKLAVYLHAQNMYLGAGPGGKCATAEKQEEYNKIYRQQLTELLSHYGDIFEVWFDGGIADELEVGDILEKYAPNAVVFGSKYMSIRWVGHEEGFAPYPAWNGSTEGRTWGTQHSDPDGKYWQPLECDARIRASWMYEADNADTLKSLDYLMDMYYRSVGHGAVLLLNNTPDTTGLIPETDVKRSAEFGAEIKRRFSKSIAETSGKGEVVELALDKPTTIDHVITMEDITGGERVREYVIEGLVDGNWQQIAEGISIGHKKIDQLEAVEVSKIRLHILKAAATPLIRKLAVYNTAVTTTGKTEKRSDEYKQAWVWSPDSVTNQWTTVDIDLSPTIPEPRQYELVFKDTKGKIEIESAVLVLQGIEVPGFAEKLDKPDTYNINITATPSMKEGSIILRAKVRAKDDSFGEVIIKPAM
ncbi:alpha-L-fucosidase, partial [Planctomycetota bacterium]